MNRTPRLGCERLEDRRTPAAYTLDPTFGTAGRAYVASGGTATTAGVADAELGPDGKLWVLGTQGTTSVLARFHADGTPDATLDGDGVLTFSPWSDDIESLSLTKLSVLADGRAVVMGDVGGLDDKTTNPSFSGTATPQQGFLAIRLNADGSPDTTFGTSGRVIPNSASGLRTIDLQGGEVLPSGQVVLAGWYDLVARDPIDGNSSPTSSIPFFDVIRLTADGRLDQSYGTDGVVTLDNTLVNRLGGASEPHLVDTFLSAVVSPDGAVTVLATGHSGYVSVSNFPSDPASTTPPPPLTTDQSVRLDAVAYRLNPAGNPDATFSDDGYAEAKLLEQKIGTVPPFQYSSLATGSDGGYAVRQADGGIVVGVNTRLSGGSSIPDAGGTNVMFQMARFTAGGAADAAFGSNGVVTVPIRYEGFFQDIDRRAVLNFQGQGDGTLGLLVSVTSTLFNDPPPPTVIWKRYAADGKPLDATTADGATLPRGDTSEGTVVPTTILADASGRFVAAGATEAGGRLAAERLLFTPTSAAEGERTLVESRGGGKVKQVFFGTSGTPTVGAATQPFAGYAGYVAGAVADFDGNGLLDEVYATGGPSDSASAVRVMLHSTGGDRSFDLTPFEATFTGGVSVAAADLDGDGRAELIVSAAAGGGGRVQVYAFPVVALADAATPGNAVVVGPPEKRADFFGIDDPAFRGGATATAADLDGDGKAELIVAAGVGGGPRVAVFTGTTLLSGAVGAAPPKLMNDFFAFGGDDAANLRNGVYVTAGDLTADGRADLVFGAGAGGARRVYAVDGAKLSAGQTVPVANFFVNNDAGSRDGVPVAIKDVNGDGRPDLVADVPLGVRVYDGGRLTPGGEPAVLHDVTIFDDFAPIPVD